MQLPSISVILGTSWHVRAFVHLLTLDQPANGFPSPMLLPRWQKKDPTAQPVDGLDVGWFQISLSCLGVCVLRCVLCLCINIQTFHFEHLSLSCGGHTRCTISGSGKRAAFTRHAPLLFFSLQNLTLIHIVDNLEIMYTANLCVARCACVQCIVVYHVCHYKNALHMSLTL